MTIPLQFSENYYQSDDGLNLYYRSYGSSDNVLLCLPGMTRNCKDFVNLANRYKSAWRVITPDLRGRGQSDHDPKPVRYQHPTYVNDIWKLLDQLEIRTLTVIGTSLGAAIAMLMAARQPERVHGLVLNDIGPVVPDAAVDRLMSYIGRVPPAPDWDTAAIRVRSAYEVAFPDQPDSFWLRLARLSMRENSDGSVIPDIDPAIGPVLQKTFRKMRLVQFLGRVGLMKKTAKLINNGYWDEFRSISAPCLVLRGEISDVLPAELLEQMKLAQPALFTTTVANRGHAPFLDEPEALSAIDSFLARIAGSP